jgi:hypothetical protein
MCGRFSFVERYRFATAESSAKRFSHGLGQTERREAMRRRFTTAACVVAFMSLGVVGVALAGEVKGPPTGGTPVPTSQYNTKATDNANSVCVYSGLNDFNNGQNTRQTQTPKDAAPGSAAFGWQPDPNNPELILTCNPNGPVTPHG